jgi:hypothetical protein
MGPLEASVMCVTCLAFSVMTLFTPVSEASPTPGVLPEPVVEQARPALSRSLAEETRQGISQMLKQIPNSSETQLLQQGFQSLYVRLEKVTEDAAAEAIIDEELEALSQRVQAAPNRDQLVEILFELQEGQYQSQASPNQREQPLSAGFGIRAQTWGWLS